MPDWLDYMAKPYILLLIWFLKNYSKYFLPFCCSLVEINEENRRIKPKWRERFVLDIGVCKGVVLSNHKEDK